MYLAILSEGTASDQPDRALDGDIMGVGSWSILHGGEPVLSLSKTLEDLMEFSEVPFTDQHVDALGQ